MREYKKDNHRILHGDVIDVLKSKHIKDESVDLIFIDPPYNIGKDFNGFMDKWESTSSYLEWSYAWLKLCMKKLKQNGSMYVMTSTQFAPYFDIFIREKLGMNIMSRIIWHYDSSGVQARNHFGSLYEPIFHCVKNRNNYTFNSKSILVETKTAKRNLIDYRKTPPAAYNSKKVPGNVWEFTRVRYQMDEYEEHPTQKPVNLLERIIKASSNSGDVVLDLFGGSFTTAYAAKKLHRDTISIELNQDYLKIGLRRLGIQGTFKNKKLTAVVKNYERVNFMTDEERKALLREERSKAL